MIAEDIHEPPSLSLSLYSWLSTGGLTPFKSTKPLCYEEENQGWCMSTHSWGILLSSDRVCGFHAQVRRKACLSYIIYFSFIFLNYKTWHQKWTIGSTCFLLSLWSEYAVYKLYVLIVTSSLECSKEAYNPGKTMKMSFR
jgi:hypothetical protein